MEISLEKLDLKNYFDYIVSDYFSAIIFPMVLVYYIVFDKNIFSIVCTCLLLFSYLVPIILERKLNNEQET